MPSLFGLSPLVTAHPSVFQHTPVRSSTRSYPRFNLAMTRSLGFGSTPYNLMPYSDSLSLRLHDFDRLTLLYRVTRRLILQKARCQACKHSPPTPCKHTVSGSISLPSRGSFHLSLTVLCAIGRQVVFCLGGWSPLLPARFHVSRSTLDTSPIDFFSPTGVLPSVHGLSKPFD